MCNMWRKRTGASASPTVFWNRQSGGEWSNFRTHSDPRAKKFILVLDQFSLERISAVSKNQLEEFQTI